MPPEKQSSNSENLPSSEKENPSLDYLREPEALKERVIAILNWLRKAPNGKDRSERLSSLKNVLDNHLGSRQQLVEIADELPHDLREELLSLIRYDILVRHDIMNAGNIFAHASDYIGKPNARDVFMNAAALNPGEALFYFENYRDQPYAKEVFEKAARTAAEKDVFNALLNFPKYKNEPYAKEVLEKAARTAAEKDIVAALDYFAYYKSQPYAKDLLSKTVHSASEKGLIIVLQRFTIYKNEPYAKEVLEKAARTAAESDPFDALECFDRYQDQPYSQVVLEKAGAKLTENLSPNSALYIVQFINQLHDIPDRLRFAVTNRISAKATYDLMVLGDREIFTSSFNGLFIRLLQKVKSEGGNINHITSDSRIGIFIRLCSSYDRLGEFLSTMSDANAKEILKNFILEISIAKDSLAVATNVPDVLSVLRDKRILAYLAGIIKEAYEKAEIAGDKKFSQLYGLLSGLLSSSFPDPWFVDMTKKYPLINPTFISSRELFNLNHQNIQQNFFYNDKDGKGSFQHFLDYYQKMGWNIIDHEEYSVLSLSAAGKTMLIFANKPDHEVDGPDAIDEEFKSMGIEPSIIVHRGHSYHAARTVYRIPSNAKLVSLGSCGGYREVVSVLDKSPLAHIISTKGTGTMLVNDPLFEMLNEEILSGRDIEWRDFWTKAEKKFGKDPRFSDYVAPHMNLSVLFLRAYLAGKNNIQ